MPNTFHTAVITAVLGALLALSAAAQERHHGKDRAPPDPNEMVCEKQEVLGSRLAVRRVCMTRAQWADRRAQDRQTIDRSQTQLCGAHGGACSGGN